MDLKKEIYSQLKAIQIWKLVFWSVFNTKKANMFIKMINIGMNVRSAYKTANNLGK